ncbi:methionine synthase [Butyricicoccus sp.]|uniref:methionine synthase n=1 Tax=Butyricicoccus sp. TaxID=2049021 RepID=UPI003F14D6B6
MNLTLDRAEVLRYMGHAGGDADIAETAQRAMDRIVEIAQPRWKWIVCTPDALPLSGNDIRRHLDGCDRMAVLCATLGAAVDREIRRTGHRSMLDALALDAAAGDAIEKVCDAAEDEIRMQFGQDGFYVTGRFSPGYGDLPIGIQRDLLALCDAPRRIGLSVTPSNLLTPGKSVTALLGISAHPVSGRGRGCGTCRLSADCPYRKRGTHCGA